MKKIFIIIIIVITYCKLYSAKLTKQLKQSDSTFNAKNIDQKLNSKSKHLIRAIHNDDNKLFFELLAKGANPNKLDQYKRSALMISIIHKNEEIAKVLVKNKNVDINLKDAFGHSALYYALLYSSYDLCKLLINNNANLNDLSTEVEPALCNALKAECDQFKKIDILLKNGRDVNEVPNKTKQTPLIIAIADGNYKVVNHLLENRANIEQSTLYGITPLMGAAMFGNYKIVELLIEKKVKINVINESGNTALDYILDKLNDSKDMKYFVPERYKEYNDTIGLLKKYGAKTGTELGFPKPKSGYLRY